MPYTQILKVTKKMVHLICWKPRRNKYCLIQIPDNNQMPQGVWEGCVWAGGSSFGFHRDRRGFVSKSPSNSTKPLLPRVRRFILGMLCSFLCCVLLFCSVLFWSVLLCFMLVCVSLFCSILFCYGMFCSAMCCVDLVFAVLLFCCSGLLVVWFSCR